MLEETHIYRAMIPTQKQVTIYTDGACDPNPGGPGGYGVILIFGNTKKEISGGFRSTTNNRMEIFAALKGLELLKEPCNVTLYSDSKYLVDTMSLGWAQKWRSNNWWRNKKEKAVNPDLWEKLIGLCEMHSVEFVWVKGHVGDKYNERCDRLSVWALKQKDLPSDDGYESREENGSDGKIIKEGQPCRKCSTPVVKRVPKKQLKQTQAYFYEYYFLCPKCHTPYMVEDAKRFVQQSPSLF